VRRLMTPRNHRPDLLVRPPSTSRELERGWAMLVVDPVNQLAELADLHRRGLLSSEEFQEQKSKVLEP
jgi:Short C-terminal domain